MAQKANLGQGHPMFTNEHNPGQVTTGHRSVEHARALVNTHGRHPEKGNFERVRQTTPEGHTDWNKVDQEASQGIRRYAAPGGGKVTVHEHEEQDNSGGPLRPPEDRRVTVSDSEGDHQLSEPAAKTYIQDRFAIPL